MLLLKKRDKNENEVFYKYHGGNIDNDELIYFFQTLKKDVINIYSIYNFDISDISEINILQKVHDMFYNNNIPKIDSNVDNKYCRGEIYYNIGLYYIKNNDMEKMINYFEKSINENKNIHAHYQLSRFYFYNKKYDKMNEFIKYCLDKQYKNAYFIYAEYNKILKKYDEMIKNFELSEMHLGYYKIAYYYLFNQNMNKYFDYLILAIEKCDDITIKHKYISELNIYLHNNFDINNYIKSKKYLSAVNINKINTQLNLYDNIKNSNITNKKINCCICYEENIQAFYNKSCLCNEMICCKCIININKCPLCRTIF